MIASFLFRNVRILMLAIVVILVAGISSFLVMPRLEDPVLGRRVGLISTVFPGANARKVESLVSIPLEEQLAGISKIKQVRSNSQNGISNVVIELEDSVSDVEPVWSIVRTELADAQSLLPEPCFPSQLEVVPLKAFAAIIAVSSVTDDSENLPAIRQTAELLRSQLIAIPGTERVDVFGDPGEEIVVRLEPERLVETGLSIAAIAERVTADLTELPAGRLSVRDSELGLYLQEDLSPVERVTQTTIPGKGAATSYLLSDLATVQRQSVGPPKSMAIIDGDRSIVLGCMVDDKLRVDRWADQLQQILADSQTEDGWQAELLFSQRRFVDKRMRTLFQNLGIGTAAVTVVVLIMMGWRSTLIITAALPLSALIVLACLRGMSIPIHQMSVTGLIIAIGLLIDNAIVIVEEVRVRMVETGEPLKAIIDGVSHLKMPLFGSTLTTVMAFLPIALLPGPPGEFVGSIAISVILAISASFILAMTVIPVMIGLLGSRRHQRGFLSFGLTIPALHRLYRYSLKVVFRFPILGLLLGIILPTIGFQAAVNLPEQFFPASDRRQIQIEVELDARASIQKTQETVSKMQEIVSQSPEVNHQHWFIGQSAPTFYYNVVPRRRGTPFYAQAFLDLDERTETQQLVQFLQSQLDQQVPEARILVRQLEQGPPFDAPIEVRVNGPDLATLQRLGRELRSLLSETNDVIHTRSDLEETIPSLSLAVNEDATAQAHLDRSKLSGLIYTTLEGASAGTVFDGTDEVPVRIRMPLEGEYQQERLAALPLPGKNGSESGTFRPDQTDFEGTPTPALNPITLGTLTEFGISSDVGAIVRINGERVNEVKAYIRAGVLPSQVMTEFQSKLKNSAFSLPDGYSIQFGGETEQRSQAVDQLIANGAILFSLMLLTLVAAFQSFQCAFIIACVGALSTGLGPLALSWFGFPFGFMAIVGTMGLVGVAINDSIVVLAAIRANDAACSGNRSELVQVVSGCTRHILTTTVTTIAGFLPLALSGGAFWPPLAVTIAGGVGGATFLALYFVPSLHLLLCARQSEVSE